MFKLKVTNGVLHGALVELIATGLLVYVGTGSVASTGEFLALNNDQGLVARIMPIAMAFGISIAVLIYAFGHLSGGHINPAVTMTLVLLRSCDPLRGLIYMLAQFIGAVCGSLMLWASTNSLTGYGEGTNATYLGIAFEERAFRPPFRLGANQLNPNISVGNGFVFELMGTLLLCLTVCFTTRQEKSFTAGNPTMAPLAIGLSVFLAHIVLVPFTGCGINPARTFGPALVNTFAGQNVWVHSWIYYAGPFSASIISAALFFCLTFTAKKKEQVKKEDKQEQPQVRCETTPETSHSSIA